jgi:hypothetical protein
MPTPVQTAAEAAHASANTAGRAKDATDFLTETQMRVLPRRDVGP